MPRSRLCLTALPILSLLVACTIQPRVGVPAPDGDPIGTGTGTLGPRPAPPLVEGQGGTMVDQVCRLSSARSGWVAVSYFIAGDRCPANTSTENPYNGAVIERYSGRPVGTTLTVCADQAVPSGWQREYARDPSLRCEGARARDGSPTSMVIRRLR